MPTGRIDLDALRRDRDQLWAEAARIEATGVSIALPEGLWGDAKAEQDKRLEHDPWLDILVECVGAECRATDGDGREERVASSTVLTLRLKMPEDKQTCGHSKRVACAMRRLGWDGPKPVWIAGKTEKG